MSNKHAKADAALLQCAEDILANPDSVEFNWFDANFDKVFYTFVFTCVLAASGVNFYVYMQHSALLAKIPWEYFDMAGHGDEEEFKDAAREGSHIHIQHNWSIAPFLNNTLLNS